MAWSSAFESPLKVTFAKGLAGGTVCFHVATVTGFIGQVCIDGRKRSPTRNRVFYGADHPAKPEAVLVARGSAAESSVMSAIADWLPQSSYMLRPMAWSYFRHQLLKTGDAVGSLRISSLIVLLKLNNEIKSIASEIREANLPDYFPSGMVRGASSLHELGVLPLYPSSVGRPDVYRLLFQPAFALPSVTEVIYDNEHCRSIHRRGGGFSRESMTSIATRDLTQNESRQFFALLEASNFWELKSTVQEELSFDGTYTVLEGVVNGKYHAVERKSHSRTPYAVFIEYIASLFE